MTGSDAAVGHHAGSSERQHESVITPLPPVIVTGRDRVERLTTLLLEMVHTAGAASGAILTPGFGGALSERASVGHGSGEPFSLPTSLDQIPFGVIVRQPAHDEGISTVAWLRLDADGRPHGAIRLGFASARALDPACLQRLATATDHIAAVLEVDRLRHENADRMAEVERVSTILAGMDRMKAEFLSMISHELRTPLTAIIGYTDLLIREVHGPLNERQAHHEHAVKKAAHRLLALVNDLLDINRLENGQIALHLERRSVADAIQRAASDIEDESERRGISLRLDLPAAHVAVSADHERLHQILSNLLDNAMKFTPAGGVVTVRAVQQSDIVSVSVIDTGIGVEPDQLGQIWDRFYQADSSSRRHFGGTGLGLAIVRHLVERHGGDVAVTSDGPGTGSAFSFSLPVALQPALVEPVPIVAGTPPAAVRDSQAVVLIVDDEPDNREVISAIVRDILGYRVVTAVDGREALLRAQDGPDLILLDLRMPGLSGFDVARALKAHTATAHIPIVAITALDDVSDRRAARAAGCIGWVSKPFSERVLVEAVSAARGTDVRATLR